MIPGNLVYPILVYLIAVCFLVFIVNVMISMKNKNLPPGPHGFPFVGYLPFLTKNPHLKFMDIKKKYGEVFGLYLGSMYIVVLNGTNSTREAFMKPEFLGRPQTSLHSLFETSSPFFMSDIHVWKSQRKFFMKCMKDLGLGKSEMETRMQHEIRLFLEVLKKAGGQPLDMRPFLTASILKNISEFLYGAKNTEEGEFSIQNVFETISNTVSQMAVYVFFPRIKYLPFITKWLKYDEILKAYRSAQVFFRLVIETHKKTLNPENVRDFVDSYLIEMKSKKADQSSDAFNETTLVSCISDIIGAGTDTVLTTITWFVYIAAAYPDVQSKIQMEISEVIGSGETPKFIHQAQMPYTHAVILEVLRWKMPVPLNTFRSTVADTSVHGYSIPKGTTVLANLWAPLHDPQYWEDPDVFKPERFLGPDGKIIKSIHFMPFSIGKRACPGEMMASIEMFLYFVSILQVFKVSLPEGVEPTFEAELKITYALKPHSIRFLPRNS